jgi:VWFA-related protein
MKDGRGRRLKPSLQAEACATRIMSYKVFSEQHTLIGLRVLVMAAMLPVVAQDASKFSVRSDLVFLPTRVQDKKGGTVYGLRAEQFLVEDNGARQVVNVDEDPESSGLSLVVVVQCSRSAELELKKMKGLGAMIEAIAGGARHEVAVIAYGADHYVLGEFSRSMADTRYALTRLRDCASRNAATIDAVDFAIDMLKHRQNHYRRAILLIGETRDHGSKAKLNEVVAELGITDTVIYSVAFSPARDEALYDMRHSNDAYNDDPPKPAPPKPPPLEDSKPGMTSTERPPLFEWPPELVLMVNALKRNTASELAALSGGHYANFTTQKGFEAELQRISNQIHNYYLLSFKPSGDSGAGLHSLKVRVADYPDAVIQTRKSYWAGIPDGR